MPLLTLVIQGLSDRSSTDVSCSPNVKKQESSSGNVRIMITVARRVDVAQANLIAAILFEQFDDISGNVTLERIKLEGLRFTPDGAQVINQLISMHATTVTHVSMKDLIHGWDSLEDERSFESIAETFKNSPIESLNLSDNTIGEYIWKHWSKHSGLRQLLLDQVEMDEASFVELARQVILNDTLEDLYVVLVKPANQTAITAISEGLSRCGCMASLRWANKVVSPDTKLPWSGIKLMSTASSVRHLVMDGSTITVSELGNDGLCGALRQLSQLKTLKLRDIGLRDNGVRSVMLALKTSQPPLQWLDLSGNMIEDEGARAISQVCKIERIVSSLEVVVLDRNQIDTDGGRCLISALGARVTENFELRMSENPMNHSKIAMEMAIGKSKLERKFSMSEEGAQSCYEHSVRSLESEKTILSWDIHLLHEECQRLRNEKEALVKAFSILGLSNQVCEQKQLLDRLSYLEHAVQDRPGTQKGISNPQRNPLSGFDTPSISSFASSAAPTELSTPNSRVSILSNSSGDRLARNSSLVVPMDRELCFTNGSSLGRAGCSLSSVSSCDRYPLTQRFQSPQKSPNPPGSEYYNNSLHAVSSHGLNRYQQRPASRDSDADSSTSQDDSFQDDPFSTKTGTTRPIRQEHPDCPEVSTSMYATTTKRNSLTDRGRHEQTSQVVPASSKLRMEIRNNLPKALSRMKSAKLLLESKNDTEEDDEFV